MSYSRFFAAAPCAVWPAGRPRPRGLTFSVNMFTNNSTAMKIVIPGGSRQIGTVLARAFHAAGDEVVVLSRRVERLPWRVIVWDGRAAGDWVGKIDGCDVVVNLAGRSVNCRYDAVNRAEILESRVLSTRVVGQAIAVASRPPRALPQARTPT